MDGQKAIERWGEAIVLLRKGGEAMVFLREDGEASPGPWGIGAPPERKIATFIFMFNVQ